MKEKKIAKNKIRKVGHTIEHLPENVQVFTYVALHHTLEELHFQKKYKLVSDLCDALLKDRNLIKKEKDQEVRIMENLKTKMENIADKYADLIEKRLATVVQQDVAESTAICEINDGIRMLNCVAATLERINRLNNGNQTNG